MISAEDFVRIWQECETVAEAREKLGGAAQCRASRYRKQGVPLQRFTPNTGRGPLDFRALKALAIEGGKGRK